MAMDNLKDFGVNWIMFGLLFFCLSAFGLTFILNNAPDAMGDSYDKLSGYNSDISDTLYEVSNDTDVLLNITSITNPESGFLGSTDSVATSYGITGVGKGMFKQTKSFMGWILGGTVGTLLLSIFGGIIGLTALYFITKWIRNGV